RGTGPGGRRTVGRGGFRPSFRSRRFRRPGLWGLGYPDRQSVVGRDPEERTLGGEREQSQPHQRSSLARRRVLLWRYLEDDQDFHLELRLPLVVHAGCMAERQQAGGV